MSIFSKKQEAEPENIDDILMQFKELQKKFGKLSAGFDDLKKTNLANLQKIAVVRFNPFAQTGGNQSFSLALLDGNDCGVVITSLFSRNENRVYGKPIKNGASEYALTDEEKQAISIAQGAINSKPQAPNSK